MPCCSRSPPSSPHLCKCRPTTCSRRASSRAPTPTTAPSNSSSRRLLATRTMARDSNNIHSTPSRQASARQATQPPPCRRPPAIPSSSSSSPLATARRQLLPPATAKRQHSSSRCRLATARRQHLPLATATAKRQLSSRYRLATRALHQRQGVSMRRCSTATEHSAAPAQTSPATLRRHLRPTPAHARLASTLRMRAWCRHLHSVLASRPESRRGTLLATFSPLQRALRALATLRPSPHSLEPREQTPRHWLRHWRQQRQQAWALQLQEPLLSLW
mmetsp:Transcript_15286/g.59745  ORF Transcript_15286/g.59745 Transcript_15286/m.59745 type:complete len:275 (+) Transcript_15286:1205-2029(+)